jgi:hypothetical protein
MGVELLNGGSMFRQESLIDAAEVVAAEVKLLISAMARANSPARYNVYHSSVTQCSHYLRR